MCVTLCEATVDEGSTEVCVTLCEATVDEGSIEGVCNAM